MSLGILHDVMDNYANMGMILQMKYFPYTDRSVTNDFIFTIKLSHAWDYVMYYKLYACMCVYVQRASMQKLFMTSQTKLNPEGYSIKCVGGW